jgi:uncharacterized protein YdeI (YjbR/CyaY-like superfamily)
MGQRDPRVDAYIRKSAEFARPVLKHLREIVHTTCPDVEETLKWRSPAFMYEGMLCGMAAFKEHVAFGFWKHALVVPDEANRNPEAMGQFGRITRVADLPPKKHLVAYIRKAMKLNEQGVKVPRRPRAARKPLPVPSDLETALARNAKARKTFETLPPSHRYEYVEWITEAKTEPTRERRLKTSVEWLSQGKSRNWKYERR